MEEKMDKSVFKKQTLAQADNQLSYWRSKTPGERLIAGYHLSLRVFGYDPSNPPKMDKSYFVKRKRD